MKKGKFPTAISIILMLIFMFSLASCTTTPPSSDDGNGQQPGGTVTPPDENPGDESDGNTQDCPIIYFFKDGSTEYSITYSADYHQGDAYLLLYTFLYDFNCEMDDYIYSEKSNTKEIVIGDTDRAISKELKAAAESLKTTDEDFVWAYGYKDGKLGFYANSDLAIKFSWDEFCSAIIKEDTVECTKDFWVSGIKTYEEYQKELADAEALEDAPIVAQLKILLDAFYTESFSNIAEFPSTYGTPSIRPISSHPRVWVNSERLVNVKNDLHNAENRGVYLALKDAADAVLMNDGKLENKKGNYTPEAMEDIENLAFMYLVTGREKYGYAAILQSFNNMCTYQTKDPDTEANRYDNSLNGGTALYVMAEVYDWCYDLFTDDLREQFVKGTCEKYAAYLEMGYPPTLQNGVSGHGTGLQFVRNWLAFAIAAADEYPQIYNFVVGRLQAEYTAAPEIYYQSGMNFHGSPYGAGKTQISAAGQILFEIATGEELFRGVDFVPVTHSYINRLRPDDTMTRVGDDYSCLGDIYNMGNYKYLAILTATYYNDPLSKTWYKYWSDGYRYGQFTSRDMDATAAMFLLLNDTATPTFENRYSELSLTYYTKYPLSSLVARSAWGDPNAWMTFTNIEETYLGNHDHKDAGTFQIYYKGILAPDTGIYQYGSGQAYGSSYDYKYVKQTVSKNGLLIYNPSMKNSGSWTYSGGQSNKVLTTPSTFEAWQNSQGFNQAAILGKSSMEDESGLVYAYISGDITKAYDLETVDLVTRSTMTVATGDSAAPMAFIVYDRIISDSASFEKSFVLHTTNKPVFGNGHSESYITSAASGKKNWYGFTKVTGTNTFYYDNTMGPSGAGKNKYAEYAGQLTVQTLLPESCAYYYIGGDGKRFWVNGANAGTEHTSEYPVAEAGWGRVEIVPSVQSTDDTFLNVMYVGDAGVSITEQAQLIEGATHDGVVTYGSCVMFAKSENAVSFTNTATEAERNAAIQKVLVSGTVSFDTTGAVQSELDYYVTGLRAGTWTVNVGGVEKAVEVTADGAIAVFRAPVGEITLTLNK